MQIFWLFSQCFTYNLKEVVLESFYLWLFHGEQQKKKVLVEFLLGRCCHNKTNGNFSQPSLSTTLESQEG